MAASDVSPAISTQSSSSSKTSSSSRASSRSSLRGQRYTPLAKQQWDHAFRSAFSLLPPKSCIPFSRLQANLKQQDMSVALKALHIALSEIGDGTTYAWRRTQRHLRGLITPTSSFRDENGAICRHVVYTLTLGRYARKVEMVACRDKHKNWTISG